MKIITNTPKNGEDVHIQVKDLLYLGRSLGNTAFFDEYINLLNSQKNDYDFIRINDEEKRDLINITDIADFKELYKESGMLLSRTLINLSFSSICNESARQKCEDIRDVLAFKRGELSYCIPLLSDGNVYIESESGYLIFSSTIFPDCYTLRTIDYSNIQSYDYHNFLSACLNAVKNNYVEGSKDDYQIDEADNMIVVRFNAKNKRKDNKLLSSLKKAKNKVLKSEE